MSEKPTEMVHALEAVLLFHSGGQWGQQQQERWFQLTGQTEATTKALCDAVRSALAEPKP